MKPGSKHSPETIQRISETKTGHTHSEETKRKIREARKKQKPPNLKHGHYTTLRSHYRKLKSIIRRFRALFELASVTHPDGWEELMSAYQPLNGENGGTVGQENISQTNQEIDQENNQKNQETSQENGGKTSSKTSQKNDLHGNLNLYLINIDKYINNIKINYNKNYKTWLPWVQKKYNLSHSLDGLKAIQETAKAKFKEAISNHRHPEYFDAKRSVPRIKKLGDVYCDCVREQTEEVVRLFNPYKKAEEQKNFLYLVQLDAMLNALEIKGATERSFYIKAVMEQKEVKFDYVTLRVLISPLCLLDFLFFMKQYWADHYQSRPDKEEKENKKAYYATSYHKRRAGEALGYCNHWTAVYGGKFSHLYSRLEIDILRAPMGADPNAPMGVDPMITYYLWCSPFIRKFREAGILQYFYPEEVSDELKKLNLEAKQNAGLQTLLISLTKTIDERWRKTKIRASSDQTKKDILDLVSELCPEKMKIAYGILEITPERIKEMEIEEEKKIREEKEKKKIRKMKKKMKKEEEKKRQKRKDKRMKWIKKNIDMINARIERETEEISKKSANTPWAETVKAVEELTKECAGRPNPYNYLIPGTPEYDSPERIIREWQAYEQKRKDEWKQWKRKCGIRVSRQAGLE